MGVYDYIHLPCPNCGKDIGEIQTRAPVAPYLRHFYFTAPATLAAGGKTARYIRCTSQPESGDEGDAELCLADLANHWMSCDHCKWQVRVVAIFKLESRPPRG